MSQSSQSQDTCHEPHGAKFTRCFLLLKWLIVLLEYDCRAWCSWQHDIFHGHKVATIDLKSCEPQVINKFYLLLKVTCRLLHLSLKQLLLCFCANICLLAEPRGCKFRVFPGQKKSLYCQMAAHPLGPHVGLLLLWECWPSAMLPLNEHVPSISLFSSCIRAPHFDPAVDMDSFRFLLSPKLASHVEFFSQHMLKCICHEGGWDDTLWNLCHSGSTWAVQSLSESFSQLFVLHFFPSLGLNWDPTGNVYIRNKRNSRVWIGVSLQL